MSVLLRALISMTWNVQQPTEAPSVNTCAHSAVDKPFYELTKDANGVPHHHCHEQPLYARLRHSTGAKPPIILILDRLPCYTQPQCSWARPRGRPAGHNLVMTGQCCLLHGERQMPAISADYHKTTSPPPCAVLCRNRTHVDWLKKPTSQNLEAPAWPTSQ